MNIIVCIHLKAPVGVLMFCFDVGNTLWTNGDPGGTVAAAPARTREGAAGAGPRAYKARTAGEEARRGHQAKRKGWTDSMYVDLHCFMFC